MKWFPNEENRSERKNNTNGQNTEKTKKTKLVKSKTVKKTNEKRRNDDRTVPPINLPLVVPPLRDFKWCVTSIGPKLMYAPSRFRKKIDGKKATVHKNEVLLSGICEQYVRIEGYNSCRHRYK